MATTAGTATPVATTAPDAGLAALERIIIASVGVTARAVAAIAPDLTLLQWRALVVLAWAPDGLSVSDLATRIGSGLPATSRLVGRLRSRGLVDSAKDPADARVTVARLAPGGRDVWERVSAHRREELRAAIGDSAISAADAEVLERLAERLVELA